MPMQIIDLYQQYLLYGPRRKRDFTRKVPLSGKKIANQTRLTELNVAVSVLSMFILLVKFILFVLNIWFPILGTIISAFTGALWITSMYGQMGPDFNDPKHPSQIAWYIRKSCDIARPSGNYHYCVLAKVTFADTTLMS